jgi:hypothetical protein
LGLVQLRRKPVEGHWVCNPWKVYVSDACDHVRCVQGLDWELATGTRCINAVMLLQVPLLLPSASSGNRLLGLCVVH